MVAPKGIQATVIRGRWDLTLGKEEQEMFLADATKCLYEDGYHTVIAKLETT